MQWLTFGDAVAFLFLFPRSERGLERFGHLLVGAGRQRRHLRRYICKQKSFVNSLNPCRPKSVVVSNDGDASGGRAKRKIKRKTIKRKQKRTPPGDEVPGDQDQLVGSRRKIKRNQFLFVFCFLVFFVVVGGRGRGLLLCGTSRPLRRH